MPVIPALYQKKSSARCIFCSGHLKLSENPFCAKRLGSPSGRAKWLFLHTAQSTGLLHLYVRAPEIKKLPESFDSGNWYAERDSFAFSPGNGRKPRCRARRAGHGQHSTGLLHLYVRVPEIKSSRNLSIPGTGTPKGTRTPDLLIRSQSLYPTELSAHMHSQVPEHNNTAPWNCQALFSGI